MAAAPGPRAVKLAQVMQLALDRTLGALPQETFLGCFPAEIVNAEKSLLLQLHETILQSIESNVKKEFEVICSENALNDKLNRLDDLALEQPTFGTDQRCPPSALAPADELRREGYNLKEKEKEHLTKLLHQLETETTELKAKMQNQQARKEQLLGQVTHLQSELEKVVELSKHWDSAQAKALITSLSRR
jgi:hypothetical protein